MKRGRFNAGFAAAGMMYNQAVTVLSGVLIGRVVGAADYGIANIAKNLFQIALVIAPLGLDLALQRYLAGDRAAEPARRAVLLVLRVLTFALALLPALALVAGLGEWLEGHIYRYPDFAWVMLVTFAALPFATDGAVTGGAYRGMRRPAAAVLATYVLMPTARVVLVCLFFLLGWRLWAIIAATTGAQLVAWAYVFLRARRDFPAAREALPDAPRGALDVLAFSWAMGLALIAAMITKSVDVLVLGHFESSAEVGRYVAVQLLVQMLTIFSAALGQTLAASVRERFEAGDPAGVEALLVENMRRIALAVAPLFAIILFWGDRIDLVLGPSFFVSWPVVVLLATNQVLFALFAYTGYGLSMTGRHKLEAFLVAGGLVAALVLCLFLVPRHGAVGAAAGTLAAVGGASVARLLITRRILGAGLMRLSLVWPFVAAIGLAAAVRFGGAPVDPRSFLSTALSATLALLLYGAFAWRFLMLPSDRARVAAVLPGKANRD